MWIILPLSPCSTLTNVTDLKNKQITVSFSPSEIATDLYGVEVHILSHSSAPQMPNLSSLNWQIHLLLHFHVALFRGQEPLTRPYTLGLSFTTPSLHPHCAFFWNGLSQLSYPSFKDPA